ncbi:MAG: hypothetical protein GX442_25960 [Candidatus Riflebacteria bacterium]|nr:hypothetical protein [Candidatus Riflebacteria bacterium]
MIRFARSGRLHFLLMVLGLLAAAPAAVAQDAPPAPAAAEPAPGPADPTPAVVPAPSMPTQPPANDPDLDQIMLLRDNGSGEPGEQTSSFRPADRSMHFKVTCKSMKWGSTKARWVFTALQTTSGDTGQVAEAEATTLVANEFTGKLTLPRDWPVGRYQAELFVDDKLVCTIPYLVTPPLGEMKITEHTLFRDDGKGREGEVVTAFRPTDRNKHFRVRANGLFPAGTQVKWVYTAVETDQGRNQAITEVVFDLDSDYDVLNSNLELPTDWPVGTYKVEILVGEKLWYTIDYEVKPA